MDLRLLFMQHSRFVQNLEVDQVFIKLNFTNSFHALRRDNMLLAEEEMVPEILSLFILHMHLLPCYIGKIGP